MPGNLINYVIGVTGTGAFRTLNQYSASAANAGRATEKFERSTKNLTASLGALGGFFGVRQLVEYADTWTLIAARVRIVTNSNEQAIAVQQRLFEIANRTRNTLAATAVLYTRTALNADELGRSQEELLKMTESVNAAMLISGATGVEAAQGMRQLAQALGSGRLQGDEFRTVMEAMPLVARAIAHAMGIGVESLKDQARAGTIDVHTMIDALLAKHQEYVDMVENMPFTIGQAFEVLNNKMTRMIGIINMATKTSDTFADAIRSIGDNLHHIIAGVAGVTAAVIAYRVSLITTAAVQALITSARVIGSYIQLARAVGTVYAMTIAWRNASGGIVGIVTMVAAATIGIIAYRKVLEEINEATEAWMNTNVDLNDVMGERNDIESAQAKAAREKTEDIIREAHQAVLLASVVEDAQERMKIRFDAVNQRIEAQRDLEGELLRNRIAAIDLEEEYLLIALNITNVMEKQTDLIKEQEEIIKRFLKNLQTEFANVFEKVLTEGIDKFSELFDAIKRMFFRLVAEMASAKLMQRVGTSLAASLSSFFVDSPENIAAQQAANEARRFAEDYEAGAVSTGGKAGVAPVQVMGLEYQAERSLGQTIASFIGPVIAGFFAGQMIGGMTTDPVLGAFGGALGGAATGAMVGGLPGAIAGGIAGGLGGLIGAMNRQEEEAEKLRLKLEAQETILAKNNIALQELADAFNGVTNRNLFRVAAFTRALDAIAEKPGRHATPRITSLPAELREVIFDVANQLGITLLDEFGKEIPGAMDDLAEAIARTILAITAWGDNVRDATERQKAYNILFDVEDTPMQRLDDTYALLEQLAPDLLKQFGIANLNLDSPEARAALIEGLKSIFNFIDSGELTNNPELLGAFADKGALIDAILSTKEAFDALNAVIYDFTTDFPRALKLTLFEQQFGQGVGRSRSGGQLRPGYDRPSGERGEHIRIEGDLNIYPQRGEDGEEILRRVETAAATRRTRGGSIDLDNVTESTF